MGNKYFILLSILFLLPVECFAEAEGSFIFTKNHPKYDQILKRNMEAPIRYGESISYISWDTSWEQSKKILTQPIQESELNTDYSEGLSIFWGLTDKPMFLTAKKGYLGPILIKKPVGFIKNPIHIGDSFQSYLSGNENIEQSVHRLAMDTYSALTGDSSNCLEEQICRVYWGIEEQEYVFIAYPGMSLMVNKMHLTLDSVHMITKKFQKIKSTVLE